MDQVKGYKKLAPRMQDLFRLIQHRHLATMGASEKAKHVLQEVKVNRDEQCFEAYYEHEWYKYYPNGTWA